MNEETMSSFQKLLNADVLRANLMKASLYMTAFEIVTNAIIDRPKSFFTMHDDSSDYEEHVKRRHKSPLRASLLWLQEMGCLSEADLNMMDAVREHRNDLAHKLPEFLIDAKFEIDERLLLSMIDILWRFEVWWVREFEFEIHPDWAEKTEDEKRAVADEDIKSGNMILLSYIYNAVTEKGDVRQ